MTKIAILGSGMAGLGASHRLGEEGTSGVVFDREMRPGGHTRSYDDGKGFIFDDGPHISFTRDQRLQELFAESVRGEYEILQAEINNHWRGHWIKHPAQCNLSALPAALAAKILEEFVELQGSDAETTVADNYEQWLVASYGRTFAETFPMQYGRKYHTAEARQMTTDWLGPRLYRPDLEEVLVGAIAEDTKDVHYVDHFRYPTRGGFEAYLRLFLGNAQLELGRDVVRIDPRRSVITFADGFDLEVDAVISSVPLPLLVPMIEGVPQDVVEAAARLACTQCVTVNLGIRREDLSSAHWTYVYDDDFTITRLSFPHLFSPHNTPPGCSSVQVEIYFSQKYRPLTVTPEDLVPVAIEDLRRCGLLREDEEIVHRSARFIPFGNVIFDHDRIDALALVHGFLDDVGIAFCGRYGEWGYHWTDESFVSGERAAQDVLDGQRLSGSR
jgi:protoporphyrinogen oxidase